MYKRKEKLIQVLTPSFRDDLNRAFYSIAHPTCQVEKVSLFDGE